MWVFKNLEKIGRIETIPVRKITYIPSEKTNDGLSVNIRGGKDPGGRYFRVLENVLKDNESDKQKMSIPNVRSKPVSNVSSSNEGSRSSRSNVSSQDVSSKSSSSCASGRTVDSRLTGYVSRPYVCSSPTGYVSRPYVSSSPTGYFSRRYVSSRPTGYVSRPYVSSSPTSNVSSTYVSLSPASYVSGPCVSLSPANNVSSPYVSSRPVGKVGSSGVISRQSDNVSSQYVSSEQAGMVISSAVNKSPTSDASSPDVSSRPNSIASNSDVSSRPDSNISSPYVSSRPTRKVSSSDVSSRQTGNVSSLYVISRPTGNVSSSHVSSFKSLKDKSNVPELQLSDYKKCLQKQKEEYQTMEVMYKEKLCALESENESLRISNNAMKTAEYEAKLHSIHVAEELERANRNYRMLEQNAIRKIEQQVTEIEKIKEENDRLKQNIGKQDKQMMEIRRLTVSLFGLVQEEE